MFHIAFTVLLKIKEFVATQQTITFLYFQESDMNKSANNKVFFYIILDESKNTMSINNMDSSRDAEVRTQDLLGSRKISLVTLREIKQCERDVINRYTTSLFSWILRH